MSIESKIHNKSLSVFLNLENLKVLIVGGGSQALKNLNLLVESFPIKYNTKKNDFYLFSLPENYFDLSETEKLIVLSKVKGKLNPKDFNNDITKSTLESIQAIKTIQENNGEFGANRYIISNNESALNVMETFAMIRLNDWENPTEIVQKHTFILESVTLDVLHIPSGFLSHIKALQDNAQLLVLADYKLKEIADEYKFPLETFNF